MRGTRKTSGALRDLSRKEIVCLTRLATRGLCIGLGLHARSCQGEDAPFDAGAIHGAQPDLAEVGQALEKSLAPLRRQIDDGRRPIVFEAGGQEMLFDSDLLDHAAPVRPYLPTFQNADTRA